MPSGSASYPRATAPTRARSLDRHAPRGSLEGVEPLLLHWRRQRRIGGLLIGRRLRRGALFGRGCLFLDGGRARRGRVDGGGGELAHRARDGRRERLRLLR